MNATTNNAIAAFSEEHATRLTGVTKSQLRYWDRTNFFVPSYAEENRRVVFSRVYSFKDILVSTSKCNTPDRIGLSLNLQVQHPESDKVLRWKKAISI